MPFSLLLIPWFSLADARVPGTTFRLEAFGLLVALGVWLGARTAERRATRVGIRGDLFSEALAYILIAGFVLGHVFDLLAYHPQRVLEAPIELLLIWRGMSSFGGLFGAIAGGLLWQWRRRRPVLPIFDQVAYALPAGWLCGRLGCFVVHDHPGKLSDFVLAVDNYQYVGLITGPRHDLGLYEVIWSALVMGLFVWLDRRPRPHGFFAAWIAILYAPVRFGLEFLRVADTRYWGLTPGHYAATVTLALGLWCLWRVHIAPIKCLPENMLARHVGRAGLEGA